MVTSDPGSPAPDLLRHGPGPGVPARVGPYLIESVVASDDDESTCVARAEDGRLVELRWRRHDRPAEAAAELRGLARKLTRAEHPHLVRLLDAGADPRDPRRLYVVTELVSGTSLAAIISETVVLHPERVLRWADELAGAVDHLHAHDLTHGAINPENVIIDAAGRARLAGAGTADGPRRPAAEGRAARERRLLMEGVGAAAPLRAADTDADVRGLAETLYVALGGRLEPGRPVCPVPGVSVQVNLGLLAALGDDDAMRPTRARELVQGMHGAPMRQHFMVPSPPARRRRLNVNIVAIALAVTAFGYGCWLWFSAAPRPSNAGRSPTFPVGDGAAATAQEARPSPGGPAAPIGQSVLAKAAPPVSPPPPPAPAPELAAPPESAEPAVKSPAGTQGAPTLAVLRGQTAAARAEAVTLSHGAHPVVSATVASADQLAELAVRHETAGRLDAAAAAFHSAFTRYREAAHHDAVAGLLDRAASWWRAKLTEMIEVAAALRLRPPRPGDEIVDSVDQRLVFIGPGTFTMGSPDSETGRSGGPAGETVHTVRLTRGFWISRHEVTRGQFARFVVKTGHVTDAEHDGWSLGLDQAGKWRRVTGLSWRNPGYEQADDHPVVCVSRRDGLAFCTWLGALEGRPYALPTEAQWEYAARAGAITPWHWGDSTQSPLVNGADATWASRFAAPNATGSGGGSGGGGWDFVDGFVFTAPVGSFPPNAWGLFDVHGNAAEWCRDGYASYVGDPRVDPIGPDDGRTPIVMRGGSFASPPASSRAASRDAGPAETHFATLGFRASIAPDP